MQAYILIYVFESLLESWQIIARNFAANYRTKRKISRKFLQIKAIDVAKMRRNIAICRRDFASLSEIFLESREKHEFCRNPFAIPFHNTLGALENIS